MMEIPGENETIEIDLSVEHDTDHSDTESDPIAIIYEVRSLSAIDCVLVDWHEYVEELPKSSWKRDDDGATNEVRNERKLVYGDDMDADSVVAYHYEFEGALDRTIEKFGLEDPRGSDRLNWVRPLVPAEDSDETPEHDDKNGESEP